LKNKSFILTCFLLKMGIGFWAKVGNFFKGIGRGIKKAFHWIGEKILPVAKVVAPIIGGAVGGPAGAAVASGAVNTIGGVLNAFGNKGEGGKYSTLQLQRPAGS
jgi:hypothetical protein